MGQTDGRRPASAAERKLVAAHLQREVVLTVVILGLLSVPALGSIALLADVGVDALGLGVTALFLGVVGLVGALLWPAFLRLVHTVRELPGELEVRPVYGVFRNPQRSPPSLDDHPVALVGPITDVRSGDAVEGEAVVLEREGREVLYLLWARPADALDTVPVRASERVRQVPPRQTQ